MRPILARPSAPSSPAPAAGAQPAPQTFDVVVYGGTAGGVVTAISAAREGASVALLEPRDHLGGMVSGGLGWTDFGKKEVIGGYALEFYERAGKKYGVPIQWYLEPHVAEAIFREWVAEAGVRVFFRHRLVEKTGVTMDGTRVVAIRTENGATFRAKVFADATYEGDLMAQAGVTFTFGREGTEQYGESLAGVRDRTPLHQFQVSVPARDASGALLPEISGAPRAAAGTADTKLQAYNFRLCMTQKEDNRVPFPKPAGLRPGALRAAGEDARGHGPDQAAGGEPTRRRRAAVATRRTGSRSHGRSGT